MDARTTLTIHQEFHRAGYDLEEEYFYRANRRAVEQLNGQTFASALIVDPAPEAPRRVEVKPQTFWQRIKDMLLRPRPVSIGEFPI